MALQRGAGVPIELGIRGFSVPSFVWQNIPCQPCKSATEPPISRTRFLVVEEYVTGVCTNQLLDTDSAGGNVL